MQPAGDRPPGHLVTNSHQDPPIGIFDSGVGGLTVLRSIVAQMPHESLLYVADQGHVPYGSRSLEEVRSFSEQITRFLLGQHAKIIVVACNSASAAALKQLRMTFPTVPFVGMEPAVKPAAEQTQSAVVGVLATPATFQGALFASVVERFATGVTVLQATCPGLVERIEAGDLDSPPARHILETALGPMLDRGIDTVVLACTHFPFVIPLIQQIVGPGVRVIDPAPAVARQTQRLLEAQSSTARAANGPSVEYFTTGASNGLQSALRHLIGAEQAVAQLVWGTDGNLSRPVAEPADGAAVRKDTQ